MIVGALRISALLRECHSLKDKRRIVKGWKDRVRHRLNAAVAEVEYVDVHQRTGIAVVAVAKDTERVQETLDLAEREARREVRWELVDVQREMLA